MSDASSSEDSFIVSNKESTQSSDLDDDAKQINDVLAEEAKEKECKSDSDSDIDADKVHKGQNNNDLMHQIEMLLDKNSKLLIEIETLNKRIEIVEKEKLN